MLPEALRFQVGLIDQISKPLGNIKRQMSDVTNTYKQGTQTMVSGAAGMVGAGFALQQALMPAIEMDRKLGEVKSLGVADDQLKTLAQTAMEFSVEYGKSATEFVDSSYKIQSAISSLKGNELSELTHISGVMAAATKADTETITGYMGQMHKIFNDDAVQMGNVAWAQKLAGQTATVVKMFNTEGKEMAAAFQNFQSIGTKNSIAMEEQFAVLGTLQAITQSGARAGTQYSSFLQGVAKAQGKFGDQVAFQNQDGSMKSVIDIMGQLKTLYGDTLELSEQAELKEAFGGQQAVNFIMNMMDETDGLNKSIRQLQDVSGLKEARDMAHSMTDQWERLEQGVFAVRSAFGAALLPALLPVISSLADGAMEIIEWTQMFPNLTKYIGFAALALLGFVAINGLITLVVGVGMQALASYTLVMKAYGAVVAGLSNVLKAFKVAMLAANIAIAANPIFLIAAGVVAAIAAVGALIYYWDDLKASFGDTAWFQVLTVLSAQVRMLFEVMKGGWQWVMSGFSDTSGFDGLFTIVDEVRAVFANLFGWISESFGSVLETVKGVADWIPGFGSDDESSTVKSKSVKSATPYAQVQPGGAAKSIASYQTSSTNYGGVAIYPTYMSSPQDMASELEMAAG
ncbi:phage tail tape measure protein [Vibrio splendidus]|uniref:phage tail tape measure protein n=1 Tax=Vibrio splendidus TaxID=29497 RepID=UPI0000671096|nr:phage tail tape measure protein [Vibrio splendidus]EAP92919.1 prophage PSPPH06, tail tape measure protein, TP901 family [Vibrio splendidus 12B01]